MIINTRTGVKIIRNDFKYEAELFARKVALTVTITALLIAVFYAGMIIFD